MRQIKKIENLIVIAYICMTLCFLNGSFLAYCNGYDPTLELIQKFGSWINAGLWQSSKVFVTYAIADAAWNIHYVGPRILRSVFIVKWADRLNGLFGFSTKGELEEHLAKQIYSPLYRDVMNSAYVNIGGPVYNMAVQSLGLKPKVVPTIAEPITFEVIKEVTREINKIHVVEEHDKDVLALRDEIHKARLGLDNLAMSRESKIDISEINNEILSLTKFEEAITYKIDKLQNEFYNFSMGSADDVHGVTTSPKKLKFLEFHETRNCARIYFDYPGKYYIDIKLDKFFQEFPIISNFVSSLIHKPQGMSWDTSDPFVMRQIKLTNWVYIDLVYHTTKEPSLFSREVYELLPGSCMLKTSPSPISFDHVSRQALIEASYESFPLIDKIRENLLQGSNRDQTKLDEQLSRIEALLVRHETENAEVVTSSHMDSFSEESDSVSETSNIRDGSVASTTINWLPAVSVGALTTLSIGQALIVFSYFFGIDAFHAMVQQNLQIQDALVQLYTSNGLELPPFLSDAINNSTATPSISVNTPNVPAGPEIPVSRYLFYGLLIISVAGVTWYLVKTGMDVNNAIDTATTYEETLRSRYTNFK